MAEGAEAAMVGLGEERPSTGNEGIGRAERGVVEVEVDCKEADCKLVDDPDMGVYGEARGWGELSFILADLGGTSGGLHSLTDRRRLCEFSRTRDEFGMTSGANDFGDSGCLGCSVDLELACCTPELQLLPDEIASSASSSSNGPDIHDSMLSPNICCLQLFPGALIDRSCKGGRPGIVARIYCQFMPTRMKM